MVQIKLLFSHSFISFIVIMEEVLLWSIFACCLVKKKKRLDRRRSTTRSMWSRKWLLKRQRFSHIRLLHELRDDPNDWRNYLRMDIDTYSYLLELVTPHITKQDTCMRTAISPHERLTATLRFLATGRSYKDLEFTTIISKQSLSEIIPETCKAIYMVLKNEHLKVSYCCHIKYICIYNIVKQT